VSHIDENEIIQSLMRLRKRFCGVPSGASVEAGERVARDRAEFQTVILAVKALIEQCDRMKRLQAEGLAVTVEPEEEGGKEQ
jgi:hypothetical protein